MSLWSEIRHRLDALLRGDRSDRETSEEIRFHLEMEARMLEEGGHSRSEAERLARVAFGRSAQVQEEVREARGIGWLSDLRRDVSHGLRQLIRAPGFSLVAVLTLALGIGASTAVFSVLDGVLLRPAPMPDAGRLVMLWETDRRSGTSREPGAWPDYLDFQRETKTLGSVAALRGTVVNLTGLEEPVRLAGVAVTSGYFEMLGVAPILGRTFGSDEAVVGGAHVAVISEGLWRTRLRADPAVVGQTISMDEVPRQIIGIMPDAADFGLDQLHARAAYHGGYAREGRIEVWLPLQPSGPEASRDTHPFLMLGRLADGASVEVAQAELAGIAARLETAYRSNIDRGVLVERLVDVVFGPTRPVLWLLTAAVFLVLLVACVNVANLLLARGAARAREVAVRTALGAGFSRLGRQFLTEALLLALAGAVVGVGFAYGGLALLVALAPNDIPRLGEVGIDGRVLAVTLAVTVAVGVGFGLVPTLQAAGLDVLGLVRAEGRGLTAGRTRRRGRDALVVAELALSVVLVVGAGLLIRSFQTVLSVDPGFQAAGVLKAQFQLPATRYPRDFSRFPDWTEIQAFHAGVLERARRVPGVEAVAIAAAHPLDAGFTNSFLIVGREAEARDWPEITVRGVSADYFATMGVAIQRGRGFDGTDQPRSPAVALINEEAATRFFADRDPLGQEISFWGIRRRIVGVVGNERVRGLTEPAPPAVYVAITQVPPSDGVVLVKTTDPARLGPAIRDAVAAGDPALSVFGVEPLARTMSDSVAQRRFAMMVLGAFAAVGLALALIGVYGVVTYTTSLRLRELGIRAALGAGRGEVVSLVVGEGGRLAAAGIALGWLGALAVSRLLSSLLYGVSTVDPLTFGLVPLLVLLAAIAATWVPAWRAGRVSPVEALRLE